MRAERQGIRVDEVDDERWSGAWHAILRAGHDREIQIDAIVEKWRYGGQGQFLTLDTFN